VSIFRIDNLNSRITGAFDNELGQGLDGAIDVVAEQLVPMEHRRSLGALEKEVVMGQGDSDGVADGHLGET
jgi:hypothetical protein